MKKYHSSVVRVKVKVQQQLAPPPPRWQQNSHFALIGWVRASAGPCQAGGVRHVGQHNGVVWHQALLSKTLGLSSRTAWPLRPLKFITMTTEQHQSVSMLLDVKLYSRSFVSMPELVALKWRFCWDWCWWCCCWWRKMTAMTISKMETGGGDLIPCRRSHQPTRALS